MFPLSEINRINNSYIYPVSVSGDIVSINEMLMKTNDNFVMGPDPFQKCFI
jgi:hypothetical protein